MNRPPETAWDRGADRVQDYLDHFCAPLVGVMPYSERTGLRDEVRLHIEGLQDEYLAEGKSECEALERALLEMGEPWRWGEALLIEVDGGAGRPQSRLPSFGAVKHALAWFGPPTVACLLLVEQMTLFPHQEWLLPWLFFTALLGPFAAGALAGWTAPVRARGGAAGAAAVLGLLSFVPGFLLLPKTGGLYFGLFTLLYWLPMGWLAESATIQSVRRWQRMQFLRLAR